MFKKKEQESTYCRACGEDIKPGQKKCSYCGRPADYDPTKVSLQESAVAVGSGNKKKSILIVLAVLIVASLIAGGLLIYTKIGTNRVQDGYNNLGNAALAQSGSSATYYTDGKNIYKTDTDGKTTTILKKKAGEISSLSVSGEDLYYLYNGIPYRYDGYDGTKAANIENVTQFIAGTNNFLAIYNNTDTDSKVKQTMATIEIETGRKNVIAETETDAKMEVCSISKNEIIYTYRYPKDAQRDKMTTSNSILSMNIDGTNQKELYSSKNYFTSPVVVNGSIFLTEEIEGSSKMQLQFIKDGSVSGTTRVDSQASLNGSDGKLYLVCDGYLQVFNNKGVEEDRIDIEKSRPVLNITANTAYLIGETGKVNTISLT